MAICITHHRASCLTLFSRLRMCFCTTDLWLSVSVRRTDTPSPTTYCVRRTHGREQSCELLGIFHQKPWNQKTMEQSLWSAQRKAVSPQFHMLANKEWKQNRTASGKEKLREFIASSPALSQTPGDSSRKRARTACKQRAGTAKLTPDNWTSRQEPSLKKTRDITYAKRADSPRHNHPKRARTEHQTCNVREAERIELKWERRVHN